MLNRRELLQAAAATAAVAAMGLPMPAEAGDEHVLSGTMGYGLDALDQALEGKVDLHDVRSIVVAEWEYNRVMDWTHMYRRVADASPPNGWRQKHVQRREDILRYLLANGVVVTVKSSSRNYGGPHWCKFEQTVPTS